MSLLSRIKQPEPFHWDDCQGDMSCCVQPEHCTYCGAENCEHAPAWKSRAWSSRASMREVLPTYEPASDAPWIAELRNDAIESWPLSD